MSIEIGEHIIKVGLREDLYKHYKSFVKSGRTDVIGGCYELPELSIDRQFETSPEYGYSMIFFFENLPSDDETDQNSIRKVYTRQYIQMLKKDE